MSILKNDNYGFVQLRRLVFSNIDRTKHALLIRLTINMGPEELKQ